jgi:hypothetical protein
MSTTLTPVEVLPEVTRRRNPRATRFDNVAATLESDPNQWYAVEVDVPIHRAQVVRDALGRRDAGFEATYRSGSVYARYVG